MFGWLGFLSFFLPFLHCTNFQLLQLQAKRCIKIIVRVALAGPKFTALQCACSTSNTALRRVPDPALARGQHKELRVMPQKHSYHCYCFSETIILDRSIAAPVERNTCSTWHGQLFNIFFFYFFRLLQHLLCILNPTRTFLKLLFSSHSNLRFIS